MRHYPCRGIETEAIKRTRESIREGKGVVVESGEVKPMVQGRDRRVELGHYLALMCRKSIFYPPKNKNRCGCLALKTIFPQQ